MGYFRSWGKIGYATSRPAIAALDPELNNATTGGLAPFIDDGGTFNKLCKLRLEVSHRDVENDASGKVFRRHVKAKDGVTNYGHLKAKVAPDPNGCIDAEARDRTRHKK